MLAAMVHLDNVVVTYIFIEHTLETIGQGMKRKFTVTLLKSRKEGADFDHLVDTPEKSHL